MDSNTKLKECLSRLDVVIEKAKSRTFTQEELATLIAIANDVAMRKHRLRNLQDRITELKESGLSDRLFTIDQENYNILVEFTAYQINTYVTAIEAMGSN